MENSNQKWIDELTKRIIDQDDKPLFEEATSCFLSGYNRAAYIMLWLTLIESLKRKIKRFSDIGDSGAEDALKKIEDAESKHLSTDKLIYDEAKLCGIVDDSEFSKINFLWAQRCIFAHPYSAKPDDEDVKHIVDQIIKISLGKDLCFNKPYLTELAENIVTKPFFLPSETQQIKLYANRTIARVPEKLHAFFFKTLLYQVGVVCDLEDKMSEFKKLRYFIIELFLQTNIPLEKSEWSLENRVTKFPYECFVGFVHNEIWGKLPGRIKEMLFSYFENEQDNRRLVTLRTFIRNLISHNKLEDCFIDRYTKKLKLEPFNSAIQYYGNNKLAFQRIWDELITYKFDVQNQVIDFLYMDSGIELISSLDSCEQIKLGRLIKRAAMSSHWKSQSFIRHTFSNSHYSESLKQGMAVGAFIDLDDSYDMRTDSLFDTVKQINELPSEVQVKIYETVELSLISDKIDVFSTMTYDEMHFSTIAAKIMENTPNFKEDHLGLFKKYIELVKAKFAKKITE